MYKTVALLTDFGLKDHYVGVVKGRILQELTHLLKKEKIPFINFVDISHEVPPQDIKKAALLLYFSYKYFPKDTIFLTIVDPGVGTKREALIVKTKDYTFVGPNNGVFSLIYLENSDFSVYQIDTKTMLKPPYSSTFHGRDLFAPAVAHLIAEVPLQKFTQELGRDKLITLNFPLPEKTSSGYKLAVWYVDHFGNIVTNFHQNMIKGRFKIVVNKKEIPFVKSYAYAKKGELVALFGSEGLLEIAVREGAASKVLQNPEIEIILF